MSYLQRNGLNSNLNEMISKFIIPRSEHPVSSAQIPKVPPKLAILSVIVVLTSNLFISNSDLLYCNLTIMVFSIIAWAILKCEENFLRWLPKSSSYVAGHNISFSKVWDNVLFASLMYSQRTDDPSHQPSENSLKFEKCYFYHCILRFQVLTCMRDPRFKHEYLDNGQFWGNDWWWRRWKWQTSRSTRL